MKIHVRTSEGTWEQKELTSELVSRRTSNKTWFSFDPIKKEVFRKKVAQKWESQAQNNNRFK